MISIVGKGRTIVVGGGQIVLTSVPATFSGAGAYTPYHTYP